MTFFDLISKYKVLIPIGSAKYDKIGRPSYDKYNYESMKDDHVIILNKEFEDVSTFVTSMEETKCPNVDTLLVLSPKSATTSKEYHPSNYHGWDFVLET